MQTIDINNIAVQSCNVECQQQVGLTRHFVGFDALFKISSVSLIIVDQAQKGGKDCFEDHRFRCRRAGREIAPNTGANATKFSTLATKS